MINGWNIFSRSDKVREEIKTATKPIFTKIEEGIDELGAELIELRKENKELKKALKIYESNTEIPLVITKEVTNGH